MKDKILKILGRNARLSNAQIAERLDISEQEVSETIANLENDGIIKGYKTLINEDYLSEKKVKAMIYIKINPEKDKGFDHIASRLSKFPEVVSLYLVSGEFDLILEIHEKTLKDVGVFISSKLATIDGVVSTDTHFILKKYKELGTLLTKEEKYERLKVTP